MCADKSSDEVWGIVEKFSEQDCRSLEEVFTAKDILDLKFLKNDMGVSAGICGKIVKSLNDMTSPHVSTTPPPSTSPLKLSTSSLVDSSSGFYVNGAPVVVDNDNLKGQGILKGFYINPFEEKVVKVALKLSKSERNLENERNILLELRDKAVQGVVRIHGNKTSLSSSYIVLDDCGDDLEHYMHSDNYETRKILAFKFIEALKNIHDSGLMHGDIKIKNVLVNHTGAGKFEVKLCDLEASCFVGQGVYSSEKYSKGKS